MLKGCLHKSHVNPSSGGRVDTCKRNGQNVTNLIGTSRHVLTRLKVARLDLVRLEKQTFVVSHVFIAETIGMASYGTKLQNPNLCNTAVSYEPLSHSLATFYRCLPPNVTRSLPLLSSRPFCSTRISRNTPTCTYF